MLNGKRPIPIEESTISFLVSNYGLDAQEWIDNIDSIVEELSYKWNLTIIGSEPNARFGCILYGKSKIYGEIVLKLVPPCCKRLEQEILCYKELTYSKMATLFEYDLNLGGFLLQRIHYQPVTDLQPIARLFDTMFSQRKEVLRDSAQYSYEKAFFSSLNFAREEVLRRSDDMLKEFLSLIDKAIYYYDNLNKKNLYFIHGDAHIHNILYDLKDTYLIDPIGYTAPFEIEYARFVGTFIRENKAYDRLQDILYKVTSDNCTFQDVLSCVGFDVTMRACNTFSEGNTYEEILDALEWSKHTWEAIESINL